MSKVGRPSNSEIKRKKILKTTLYIGLFLLVFGLSYALFNITLNGRKINRLSTGNFSVKITTVDGINEKDLDDGAMGIELDNAIPITDEEGKTQPSYEFNIVNDGSIDADFDLYLETIDGSTLDPSLVKYQLIKNDEEIRISNLSNTKIDVGTINSGETSRYELRIWLDYDADNTAMNKIYQGKLKLDAVQSTNSKSSYGELVKTWTLSDTVEMTYYDDPFAYNQNSKVKRLANIEERYEGGTLVISGEGEIPDMVVVTYLLGSSLDEINESFEAETDENGFFIYKYHPNKVIVEEGITKIGSYFLGMTEIDELKLPETLEEISGDSIDSVNINKLNIPSSITKLEDSSFYASIIENLYYYNSTIFHLSMIANNIYIQNDISSYEENSNYFLNASSNIYVSKNSIKESINNHFVGETFNIIVDSTKFN